MAITAITCAAPAQAHEAPGLAGGFLTGFQHPFGGMDHLLAMVAVGLWGAFLGRPLVILLPVVFPLVMGIGGVLGIAGVPLPSTEIGIALSVLALGAAIASGWRAPVWLACLMVGIFAIFHGHAHGTELPSIADPVTYSAGFVVATGALHLSGIGLGKVRRWRHGPRFLQASGAVIALFGLLFVKAALT